MQDPKRPSKANQGLLFPAEKDEARQGAVAQLGERLVCNQEVVGSIPIGSTVAGVIGKLGSGRLK